MSNKSLRGIILTVISGLFITLSLYLTTRSSRAINPFLVGYIWEIGIGIFALLYAIILSFLSCKNFLPQKYNCQLPKISLQEFGKILLISSPTLLGTGGFFYAVAHGPFAVASAISSAGGVTLSVIFAHFFYRENLNKKQIFFIFLSIILIASFILIS